MADGGAVQLHVAAPPFVVTVFTDPPQCRAGQVDLSAFVQEEKGPLLDADQHRPPQHQPVADVLDVPLFAQVVREASHEMDARQDRGTLHGAE